jgi:predicted NAD/FAD-binding protein
VVAVSRLPNEVSVTVRGQSPERFDHVVFACHSDQALQILGRNATPLESEVLGRFPYCRNVAVLHTDESVLPKTRRAWASWNYRLSGDVDAPATVTYNMNILQGLQSRHTICVTLNDEARIDPARILGRFEYQHPVFTTDRSAAQARHGELLTTNRTSFCGAYWKYGFHEDGVVSALRVVDALKSHSATAHSLRPASCDLTGASQ